MRFVLLFIPLISALFTAAKDSTTGTSFAGCYVLRVSDGHPLGFAEGDTLPKRFKLKRRRFMKENKRFVVKNLDTKMPRDWRWSSWGLNDAGSLEIILSTGFVRWNIQLNGTGTELQSSAKFFTDTHPKLSDSIAIVIHAVGCKSLGN